MQYEQVEMFEFHFLEVVLCGVTCLLEVVVRWDGLIISVSLVGTKLGGE
jgi:hypothetical protein